VRLELIIAASSGKTGMMICVPVLPARKVMIPSLTCWRPSLTASPRRNPV
jgi:hypothetical protein